MSIARCFSDFLTRTLERPPKHVKKTYAKKKHKWQQDELGVKIDLGERVVLYIMKACGDEFADKMLTGIDMPMPHKFWQRFITSEQDMRYTQCEHLRWYRALQFYLEGYRQGKRTRAAMLDGLPSKKKRKRLEGMWHQSCLTAI